MNRIEDRLGDAFRAAAEIVRPESVAALRDPSRMPRRRHVAALAAAAAVAAVIVGASVITPLTLAGGHGAPSRPAGPAATTPAAPASSSSAAAIAVPLVLGMTANQAVSVLSAAGLQVTIVAQASTGVPPGTVIAQSPAAGTRTPAGAAIVVSVAAVPASSPTPAPGATR